MLAAATSAQISDAIARSSSVRIRYRNGGGSLSERVIEPRRTYWRHGHRYVVAYCHQAAAVRTFRADRVLAWDGARSSEGDGVAQLGAAWPLEGAQPQPRGRVAGFWPERPQLGRSATVAVASVSASASATASATTFGRAASASASAFARAATSTAAPAAAGAYGATGTGSSGAHTSTSAQRSGAGGKFLAFLLMVGVIGLIAASDESVADWLTRAVAAPAARPVAIPHPEFSIAAAQRQVSLPIGQGPVASYRSIDIYQTGRGGSALYAAPTHGLVGTSLRQLHLVINAVLFRRVTGIVDIRLEGMYAAADRDRDGYLIWDEIRWFQRWLTDSFRYRRNDVALRPNEFLDQRGGDCEDWALVTAGLLRFWGWDAFIATFLPGDGGSGHAVCFVRWPEDPPGFDSYFIDGGRTRDGRPLPSAHYVPIDYAIVGGNSSAMEKSWDLVGVHTPERIYGRKM